MRVDKLEKRLTALERKLGEIEEKINQNNKTHGIPSSLLVVDMRTRYEFQKHQFFHCKDCGRYFSEDPIKCDRIACFYCQSENYEQV